MIPGATVCMSGVVEAPVDDAARALDLLVGDAAGEVRVEIPGGGLVLRSAPCLQGPPGTYAPVRRLSGTLRFDVVRTVAVELELFPWSAQAAELVLRPGGRRPPRLVERYLAAADVALRRLTTLVDHRARWSVPVDDRVAA
jgi:hypothetical protein